MNEVYGTSTQILRDRAAVAERFSDVFLHRILTDAANRIEALEAEVKRLGALVDASAEAELRLAEQIERQKARAALAAEGKETNHA